jgi:hypothetical protein
MHTASDAHAPIRNCLGRPIYRNQLNIPQKGTHLRSSTDYKKSVISFKTKKFKKTGFLFRLKNPKNPISENL